MPWQLGAQITRPTLIKEHPALVAKFIHAYRKGIGTYQAAVTFSARGVMSKGPGYDEVAAIVAKYLSLTPDKVADIFPAFDPAASLDVADVKNQVAFYQEQGMVDKAAGIDAMLDLSFLSGATK